MDALNTSLLMNEGTNMELEQLIMARPEPIVLHTSIDPTEWPDSGAALLEKVCRFWQTCESVQGRRLIHFLAITYQKPSMPNRLSPLPHWLHSRYWQYKFKMRRHRQLLRKITATIAHVTTSVCHNALHLPAFCDVSYDDAVQWLEIETVKDFLESNGCGFRRFRMAIDELYREDPNLFEVRSIPMERLAKTLYEQLDTAIPPS